MHNPTPLIVVLYAATTADIHVYMLSSCHQFTTPPAPPLLDSSSDARPAIQITPVKLLYRMLSFVFWTDTIQPPPILSHPLITPSSVGCTIRLGMIPAPYNRYNICHFPNTCMDDSTM